MKMQIEEQWDENFANPVGELLDDLSAKYGQEFYEVLSVLEGYLPELSGFISDVWQNEEYQDGEEVSINSCLVYRTGFN